MNFAVKNRKTGKFFAGFSATRNALTGEYETLWAPSYSATRFNKLEAQMQAHLLHAFDHTTQVKPASI